MLLIRISRNITWNSDLEFDMHINLTNCNDIDINKNLKIFPSSFKWES